MSTARFNGNVLKGVSYLIRLDADLVGAHLSIRDLDVHLLVRLQNQSDSELTNGQAIVGNGTLDLECYGDGFPTHRFAGIHLDGRLAIRTPRLKFALLKFRYPITQVGANIQVGWVDHATGVAHINALYPTIHANGALYPPVHLEPGAATHQISLDGAQPPHNNAEETVGFDSRRLVGFFVEDHPNNAGNALQPVKIGLHSYRTNSCRWLDMLVHQDGHWRGVTAGVLAGNIAPISLTLTNPDGNGQLTLKLEAMPGGQLLYAEGSGELAGAGELVRAGGRIEDSWELYDGTTNPLRTLAPVSAANFGRLLPLSGQALAMEGALQGAAGPNQPPVEMVFLKFAQPNPTNANLQSLRT